MFLIRRIFRKAHVFFKLVEENSQTNTIEYIKKNDVHITVGINSNGSDEVLELNTIDIIKNKVLLKSLKKNDQKLVRALVLAEGDIILISKDYKAKNEVFLLRSLLNSEEWRLTREEISDNKEILARLNIKYFTKEFKEL